MFRIPSEERFSFALDGCLVEGKYDRVDRHKGLVTIVDYKTTPVSTQTEADKKAKDDEQLTLYALAHLELTGKLPDQVVLNFVEAGRSGVSSRTERQVNKNRDELVEVAQKIRDQRFEPEQSPHECNPFADCPGHRAPHRTEPYY